MGYSIDPRCPLVLLVGRMDYWRWRLSLLVLLVGPYGLFESQATTPSQVFTTHHIDTDHEAAQEAAVRAVGEQLADVREARRCRPSVLALDDGRRRFVCPFHAGKLWCNEVEPSPKLRDGAEFVESADNEQMGSADPLTAGLEPRHETTIDDSPDRDHRASTPPRAPPQGR